MTNQSTQIKTEHKIKINGMNLQEKSEANKPVDPL